MLACPAPVYTDKTLLIKHLRPRLYLQLQKLSKDGRQYHPAIDVLSLAPLKHPKKVVSVLKKCVNKIKSQGNCLHFDKRDILLAKVAGDDSDGENSSLKPSSGFEKVLSHLEDLTERKVLAVLRANNKIVTDDGRAWTASKRSSGSFEFTCADEHGVVFVARWVSTKANRASTGSSTPTSVRSSGGVSAAAPESPHGVPAHEAAFNFSLIDPGTRRHAVLATLSPSNLHIKDTYHQPISTSGGLGNSNDRLCIVSQDTKTLILATAVWLNLYLGWSPS